MGAKPSLIDIHAHLLPGVDDGATDLDMSLALVDQGLEDGIGTWVLTPHVLEDFDEETDRLLCAVYDEFRDEVARRNLPVTLYLASEIMFQTGVKRVKARRSATFNDNKRYFLIEFPMGMFPGHAEEVLFDFQMAGMTPILAHPERNAGLAQEVGKIERMVNRGILMQINARSLVPKSPPATRRLAEALIMSGGASFVASDAHHPETRPAHLREAYERVAELAGEPTARRLCIENPQAAIEGERIRVVAPDPSERRRWWGRFVDRLRA